MLSYLEVNDLSFATVPFRYALANKAFPEDKATEILTWLESHAPWYLKETDFYEQWEFDCSSVKFPPELDYLNSSLSLEIVKRFMEVTFQIKLLNKIEFTAHKLLNGQTIRIHNDYIPGLETHRLIIQLNRGWKNEYGGFLMFFNSQNPSDIHRIISPMHNSMTAFEISPNSHHAVSKTHGAGERYTLVYSFYKKD